MHKEYAIDPEILTSFDKIRAILGCCGWHHGRVVCEYPKKWKRKVYDSCGDSDIGDIERKKIEQILSSKRFLRRIKTVQFNNDEKWLCSAIKEHRRKQFSAIVTDKDRPKLGLIDGNSIFEEDEKWKVPSGICPRSDEDFAKSIALLAQNSDRLVFIDPHFDTISERFKKPFRAMLKQALKDTYKRPGSDSVTIELHTAIKENYNDKVSKRKANMKRVLSSLVPFDNILTVFIWSEKKNGEKIHNRYFLTELGGLSFSIGLDMDDYSNHSHQTDDIHRLTPDQHQKRLNDYGEKAEIFELLAKFEIKGNMKKQ